MGLLGAKRKKIKNLGELGLRDPLAVTPAAEADVEARLDSKDLLQLRRRFAPKPGLYGRISRLLRFRHEVHVKLDEQGTRFWQLMDGRRTLDEIASSLGRDFDAEAVDARKAVILFTKMLMTRHLVYLKVKTAPAASG